MKRIKFNWLSVILILLAAVILCGVTMRLTNNFTDFGTDGLFTGTVNEENFFFEQIEDGDLEFIVDVDAEAKSGVITLDGGVRASAGNSLTIADEPIEFATLMLDAGEYTFSAFNKPSGKTYFAVGIYEIDGVKYAWLADTAKSSTYYDQALETRGYVNAHGQTVTFDEETEVTFFIMVVEGAELENVKAYPIIVEGDEEGDFYVKASLSK